jgi:ribosomal protein S18 acetylase RimI-like enzyme
MTPLAIDSSTHLRPETPDDHEFLAELYASTREEEMRQVEWPDEEKRAFLRSQFEAQTAHYAKHYAQAERWIIEHQGKRVGRLYLNYLPTDLRIVDIALTPATRGQGIGGTILRTLLKDSEKAGRVVSIHVEVFNPALRLYERLGFRHVSEHGVYRLMEWRPVQVNTAS